MANDTAQSQSSTEQQQYTVISNNAPFNLAYTLTIRNKDTEYIVQPEEGVQLVRAMRCVPAKLTFRVLKDDALNITEGNAVTFQVNNEVVFKGYIFKKSRNKDGKIAVMAYDQLRYFKNKDCYVYKDKTASEVVRMICDDFKLETGDIADTVYKIPVRVEKDKTLMQIINTALNLTYIYTEKHTLFELYDDAGKIVVKPHEAMKLDTYIDGETMEDFTYESSIDKDTADVVKVVREAPNGSGKALVKTGVIQDDEHIKEWGRLQFLYLPDDKVVNAMDRAKRMIALKNRKTRDIKLKHVLGDIRVRGGSGVYLKYNFGDISLDNYVMVESVTHIFENGLHTMDLDLKYEEPLGKYTVTYDNDAQTLAKIQEEKKKKQVKSVSGGNATGGGTASQVDTAFAMNEGRVSPYGSEGCADTACAVGSWYNADLAEEYQKGVASVPTLREDLEAKGYTCEVYTGAANKGDLLIYGDDDHVVIADGNGGCFGNSSSLGYAKNYGDANYAYGNGEPPTKIIRMGVQ